MAKKGGIIIPGTAKEKPMESVVVAVGTGKTGEDGRKIPLEVKKGDRVLVSRYGGTEIKLEGKDCRTSSRSSNNSQRLKLSYRNACLKLQNVSGNSG